MFIKQTDDFHLMHTFAPRFSLTPADFALANEPANTNRHISRRSRVLRLHHKTEARGVPLESRQKKKVKRWTASEDPPAQAMQCGVHLRERHPRDHAKMPKKKKARTTRDAYGIDRAESREGREKFGSSLKGAKRKKETTSGSTMNREKRLHPHIDGAMKADH